MSEEYCMVRVESDFESDCCGKPSVRCVPHKLGEKPRPMCHEHLVRLQHRTFEEYACLGQFMVALTDPPNVQESILEKVVASEVSKLDAEAEQELRLAQAVEAAIKTERAECLKIACTSVTKKIVAARIKARG